jgi:hypothetical protein
MKTYAIILTAVTVLCLGGCSKQSGSSSSKQRYVPESGQVIMSSPEWKLDLTTKTGLKCYVKTVPEEVRKIIATDFDHPDHEYLQEPSEPSQPAYFLVMIRNGSIIDELAPEEIGEITGYILKHDKGFSEMLKVQ